MSVKVVDHSRVIFYPSLFALVLANLLNKFG